MSPKLLFITSHYFYPSTMASLSRLNLPCETLVVAYDDFEHISALYGMYADQYDACFTSGVIAKQAIELAYPTPRKPLIPYQVSSNGLHRDILRVMLDTQSMDLSRIAMDFLITLGSGYSVADFLQIEDLSDVYAANANLTKHMGTKDGRTVEHFLLERIEELWKNKAIDLVICQYSSIIPRLQELGIPYRCSAVSDQHLNALIQEVLIRLELQKLHDNHPAIIQIFSRKSAPLTEAQFRLLRHHVQQFVKSNLMECVLQEANNCCMLITSMKTLRFLTDEFRTCRISSHLNTVMDIPILVGYGVGGTVPHAMNNVQIASKEAKIHGKSFIVDSNGNIIGPLDSERAMVLSPSAMPDISQIAKRCNLSSMTIQKIITILETIGSDKITTQELSTRLHTTVRNANRIMVNLCKGGIASPVYTQSTRSRGRPVQVYSLNFGTSSNKSH